MDLVTINYFILFIKKIVSLSLKIKEIESNINENGEGLHSLGRMPVWSIIIIKSNSSWLY